MKRFFFALKACFSRAHIRTTLLALLLLSSSTFAPAVLAFDVPGISRSALPAEARTTLDLIARGGPFPYRRDGIEFQNRERRLPMRERGYYREYTVPTPGAQDRGARRIISGAAQEYYYTEDHYRNFRRVQP